MSETVEGVAPATAAATAAATPTPPGDPGAAPSSTVLCVDDEPNILSALKRVLRGAGHCVLTASGGAPALTLLEQMPVDLVISDMRMPGMDGAQLLAHVHERWPHVVRILLTGHADTPSAIAAINQGRVLRYLQKPWVEGELLGAVREGLERQTLQRERDRLLALTRRQNEELAALNADLEARVTARTTELAAANEAIKRHYLKSIKVFSNLIELRSGLLAGHGRRTADAARDIARKMGLAEDEVLRIFVSGLLHDVGLIGDSDGLMSKPLPRYTDDERARYLTHPAAGEQSLLALDDMQPLMPIIRGHHERFDGQGFPDKLAGAQIPLGARILAVADHFDELQNGHLAAQPLTRKEARTMMRHGRGTQFDPEILDVFLHITEPEKPKVEPMLALPTAALESGMVLAKDLVSARGVLMLARGHRLTGSLIARVREFELREGSRFTVHVQPRSAT